MSLQKDKKQSFCLYVKTKNIKKHDIFFEMYELFVHVLKTIYSRIENKHRWFIRENLSVLFLLKTIRLQDRLPDAS
jgi:hypothetical protein